MLLPQCAHITRKRGVYYFRRRLPSPHAGEVSLSLGTRKFRAAEWMAESLSSAFEAIIAKAMTQAELQAILRDHLREKLAMVRKRLVDTPYGTISSNGDEYDTPEEAHKADIAATEFWLRRFKSDLAERDVRAIEPYAARIAKENNVPEELLREFTLGMMQASVQIQEQKLVWLREGVTTPIDLTLPPPPLPEAPKPVAIAAAEPEKPQDTSRLLSDILPSFLAAMGRGGWRGQTMAQNQATYRMFQEVCGDRPIGSYRRRDLSQFYQTLCALPALWSKKTEWRDMPLVDIAENTKDAEVDRLSMKTVKRHFAALSGLFEHCRTHGEFEGDNPARGFDFPSDSRAKDDRDMWEGEELARLFASPVWTGCQSEARRSTPGSLIIKDEKYWLPLLALYHGNRLEELAQLQREDMKQEDGIWYLDINDEDEKQLKNAQSRRRVPLHPKLKAMGFIEYVESTAPNTGDRLFPQLEPGGPDNKLGYYFTKWWSRYRQDVGVYRKKLDYHSFRHGVTTKLYAAEVQEAYVDELTGHAGGGTSRRVYLKRLPLQGLYDAICKVEWPEVVLALPAPEFAKPSAVPVRGEEVLSAESTPEDA